MAAYNPALPGRHEFNEKGLNLANVTQLELEHKLVTRSVGTPFPMTFSCVAWGAGTVTVNVTPVTYGQLCWLVFPVGQEVRLAEGALAAGEVVASTLIPAAYRPVSAIHHLVSGLAYVSTAAGVTTGTAEADIESTGAMTVWYCGGSTTHGFDGQAAGGNLVGFGCAEFGPYLRV